MRALGGRPGLERAGGAVAWAAPVGASALAVALFTTGHMVVDMYQGAVPALLPMWKQSFALPYAATGFIMLLFNLVSSVVQPALGLAIDRLRSRYLPAAAVGVTGAGMVAAMLAPGYGVLLASILVGGLGVALFHPEASRRVHEAAGPFQATVMAWFTVGGNLGHGLGPLMVGLLSSGGFGRIAWGFALVGAAMAAVYLAAASSGWMGPWAAPQPAAELARRAQSGAGEAGGAGSSEAGAGLEGTAEEGRPMRHGRYRVPWGALALLGTVVVLRAWANTGVQAFVPLLLTSEGVDMGRAQRLISVFLLAGAVGTLAGGRAADRLGAKRVLVGSMAVVVPLLWLLARGERAWLVPLLLASGFFLISSFPVTLVMAQHLLPGHVATASGFVLGLGVGTGGMGVTLLGWVADRWGLPAALHGLFLLPLLAMLVGACLPSSVYRGAALPAAAASRR